VAATPATRAAREKTVAKAKEAAKPPKCVAEAKSVGIPRKIRGNPGADRLMQRLFPLFLSY
jgi:hypothetical protein